MIEQANRSFLIAGLEPGRFVELPGKAGILFVGDLSTDGRSFKNLFVQREKDGRLDIITAGRGELVISRGARVLRLYDGYRTEGQLGRKDFRRVRFSVNEIKVPEPTASKPSAKLDSARTLDLMKKGGAAAMAELNWRLAIPLFAGILSMLAIPLARSEPRQPQYGLVLFAIMSYGFGMLSMLAGTYLTADGRIPIYLGLWWVMLPMAGMAYWLYWRDGRFFAPRGNRA